MTTERALSIWDWYKSARHGVTPITVPGMLSANKPLEEKYTTWQQLSQFYQGQAENTQNTLTEASGHLESLSEVDIGEKWWLAPTQFWNWGEGLTTPGVVGNPIREAFMAKMAGIYGTTGVLETQKVVKDKVQAVGSQLAAFYFYNYLYGQVPAAIYLGAVTNVDEVLASLRPEAAGLSSGETDYVRGIVSDMFESFTTPVAPTEPTPGVVPTETGGLLPALVAPTGGGLATPVNINQLTIDEIKKALTTPMAPPQTMTDEEWKNMLLSEGYTEEDLEASNLMSAQAEALVADWQEISNQLEAFRSGLAEMPSYTVASVVKEALLQPAILLMDVANVYFEHVSQPLAGLLYKTFVPDIDAAYRRYEQAGENTWQALAHAWQEWDAPGQGAGEWILKYILMEGLVDPLSYVGWGIATRITKPLGVIGRMVGAAEGRFMAVLDVPFDLLKAGLRKLPKTMAQEAAIAQAMAGQYVDRFMTQRFSKPIYQLTMDEWNIAAEEAVKYTISHPQIDNITTRAGTQLLKHTPVTDVEVWAWAQRLKTTLTQEQVTRQTVESVDRVFEDYFSKLRGSGKLITPKEAAVELIQTLSGRNSEEVVATASRILSKRASDIVSSGLSFGTKKTANVAMGELIVRNYRLEMTIRESAVALARKELGSVASMLTGIPIRVQRVWSNIINRWIVRPFAEAYLTFALYGPMNIVEDTLRSMLGGVFPGRTTREVLARELAGVSYPAEFMTRDAVSETMGFLRARPEGELNNWILQMGGLAPGLGDKTFNLLVRRPGQIGMDMRMNFYLGRYRQILNELGGDAYKRLTEAIPERVSGVSGKLAKEIRQVAGDLAVQGKPEMLRSAIDDFTRPKILRREVNNIRMEHPDLPRTVQDLVMQAYDDGRLLRSVEDIEQVMSKEAREILVDDFLHSSEYAAEGYEALYRQLAALEVKSPEEMATLVSSLYTMSTMYGATPSQIMGRAVERSRMLPLVERRTVLDKAMDSITAFRERAGIAMDDLASKIRQTILEPGRMNRVDWSKVDMRVGGYEAQIKEIIDNLPIDIKLNLRAVRFDARLKLSDAKWSPKTKTITIRTPEQIGSLYHEVAHSISNDFIDAADYSVIDAYSRIYSPGGGTPSSVHTILDEMALKNYVSRYGAYYKYFKDMEESFATDFADWVKTGRITRGTAGVANTIPAKQKFFEEYFPKFQRELPTAESYRTASTNLLNIQTAKRVRSAELGEQINGFRHEFFANVSAKDLKAAGFWDNYSREISSRWNQFNSEMARFDGQIKNAMDNLNIAGGAKPTQRAPIKVTNRPLAPQDVAKLMGVRGDDISRALLDTMVAQNNRDMFVQYVMAHVRKGDIGFTEDAIGKVYDQIMNSLNVRPETASWLSGKQIELDAFRRDLHTLYNSKILPPEEITAIKNFFNGVADKVENIVYGTPTKGARAMKPEFAAYDDVRQQAADQAAKWYYKEYTDYTNANVFDAMMKAIYPFWCMPEDVTILTRSGWKHHSQLQIGEEVLTVNPETFVTDWEPVQDKAVFDYDGELMVIPAKGKDIKFTPNHRWLIITKRGHTSIKRGYQLDDGYDMVPRALPHKFPEDSILSPRDAAIIGWVCTDGYINRGNGRKPKFVIYQSLEKHLIEVQTLCGVKGHYRQPTGYSREDSLNFTVCVRQVDTDRIISICPDWSYLPEVVAGLSKPAAEAMWDAMFKAEGNTWNGYQSWKQNPGKVSEAFQLLSVLLGKALTVAGDRINLLSNNKPYNAKEARRIYKEHYKGKVWCPVTPSGTWFANCNGSIIPTGNTYESQRWFWLPRSFIRHPGTFTAFERWQNNSDGGYVHIPGTSIDINPFRGTIYGTLTTRLAKRDYPEYYDSLGAAGGVLEFLDYLSRWGFYPGAHIGVPLAMIGGIDMQTGEAMPSIFKTPLEVLVAAFPDSDSVRWISDHVFGDRFRTYLTILSVNRRGGNGTLIFSKMEEGVALTPEEEQLWSDGRRESASYSALFEQFGLFRFRTNEQIKMYEEAAKAIEQMTGYTPDQQEWLRRHGYRLWDMIGGISDAQQKVLQELDYYKWVGNVRPLLPGKQQDVLNKIELAWNDVENYTETALQTKFQLERDFLSGVIGPDAYNASLLQLYSEQRTYIDTKVEEYPLMDLSNRAAYYEEYNITQPVLHPMRELANLYFSIELEETTDPETGEKTQDWDKFWAQRDAIDAAILPEYHQEWDDFLSKNSTPIEEIRRDVYQQYFRKYNQIWETVLTTYNESEQRLVNEFLYLERTGQNLVRQAEIQATVSAKTGLMLISSFRSEVSDAKRALRYANPYLDAWLYYWGRTSSFVAPGSEQIYYLIAASTGRKV